MKGESQWQEKQGGSRERGEAGDRSSGEASERERQEMHEDERPDIRSRSDERKREREMDSPSWRMCLRLCGCRQAALEPRDVQAGLSLSASEEEGRSRVTRD